MADQTTRIGLDERRRFVRLLDERHDLAANHNPPHSRDPVWQTTSVVVLDAATVEMMSGRVRRRASRRGVAVRQRLGRSGRGRDGIEPADALTFGDAERSRVPWVHLPTLVVPAEPVTASTVYTSDHRGPLSVPEVEPIVWRSTWATPPGMFDAPVEMFPQLVRRIQATDDAMRQFFEPWAAVVLASDPDPVGTDAQMWHRLVGLFATGRVVLAEPEQTRADRRECERDGVTVWVARPPRPGDTADAFLPAEFRPRSCFRGDGEPKRSHSADEARRVAADIGANAYPCPTGEHDWHVGNER